MNRTEEINGVFEKYAKLVVVEEEIEDLTDRVLSNLYELETEIRRSDIDLCISKRKNKCGCKKNREECLCVDEIYSEVRVGDIEWGSNCTFCFRIEVLSENFKITRNMGWTIFSLHKKTDNEKLLIDCLHEPKGKSVYNRWMIVLGKQFIKIPVATYSIREHRLDLRLKYMEWQR